MNRGKSSILISAICSCMATGLNLIIGIMFVPLITNRLGSEAYGYVSLANTVVTYAGLITLALNAYAVRYVMMEYRAGNEERSQTYYSSVVIASVIISLLVLAAGAVVTFNIEHIFKIPGALTADVRILFGLTTVNFCIQTVAASFLPSSYIVDRLELYNGARILAYVFQIVTIVMFFCRDIVHMWYVSLAAVVASTVLLICSIRIFRKYTGWFHVRRRYFSFKAVKTLLGAGIWNSINGLGNILNSGLDLWVSNLMLDGVATGYIAIAKTVGNVGVLLQSALSQVFQPKLIEIYALGDKDALIRKFRQIMKCVGLFVGTFFCVFVAVGDDFFTLWTPGEDAVKIYELTVLVMTSNVLEGVIGPLYYIYTLTIKNRIPCIVTVAGGLINVGSMYVLLKYTTLGAYAVVITTAVIMVFINLVTNPLYMAHCLGVRKGTFYGVLLRYIAYITVTSLSARWICGLLKSTVGQSWIKLVLEVLAVCCYCCILYSVIMLDKEERSRGISYVQGLVKKRKA